MKDLLCTSDPYHLLAYAIVALVFCAAAITYIRGR